jgi:hypothetical protein
MTVATLSAGDVWTPPHEGVEWFNNPSARAGYLGALSRHNVNSFLDAVEFLEMWRREIGGGFMTQQAVAGRSDTADMIGALVRAAHDRRCLSLDVASSFKRVAAAVGVSAECLATAVRDALDSELAA